MYVYLQRKVKQIIEELEQIKEELQDKFDNSSPSWQESDRGDECLEEIGSIDSAIESLQDVCY